MNSRRFWIMAIITCLFFIGLAFQTTRYTTLRASVLALERTEMDIIKTGKELDATISKLSSMERVEKTAIRSGMRIATPEQRIIVTDIQGMSPEERSSHGK